MPFIGQQPVTGAYHKLDSITTSATATYNLQLNGGAYSPASANHLLVSLNGVIQAPQDSFTISGSTITFASALTASDSIDFIMAFGDVLSVGVPTDGSVNTSQLANSAVTDAKIASGISSSKLTGALPALDGSALTGVDSITQADTWQNNANFTQSSGNNVDITTMVRNTSVSFGGIGTGLSASSGVFTFPETGIYFINAFMTAEPSSNGVSGNLIIRETTDGSTYSSLAITSMANMNSNHGYNWSCNGLMDVTDTSLVKFKLATYFSANTVVMGASNYTITGVTVIRLGDT